MGIFAYRCGRGLAMVLMVGGVAVLARAGLAADPPKTEWKPPRPNAVTYFRCFLGGYKNGFHPQGPETIYPFVNLSVPNKNLWTKEIQNEMRGHVPILEKVTYIGAAYIAIPVDGVYELKLNNGRMSINGRDTSGEGELRMVKGIHRVVYQSGTSHGGNAIGGAAVSLTEKDSGEEVVFFNSWKDIQQYLGTPILGQKPSDISDWKPTAEDELKVDLKKFKVEKANP